MAGLFSVLAHLAACRSYLGLQRRDVRSLQTLRAVLDFERHALVFLQRLEAVGAHFGEVGEQVITACVRLDKAEALGVIEPLDDTGLHGIAFQKKIKKKPMVHTPSHCQLKERTPWTTEVPTVANE
ncbi:hypothetical protein D3C72_983980 [compost metagenome]